MRFEKRRPEGLIKVGLFGNAASQNSFIESSFESAPVFFASATGQSGQVAFVGEIGLTGVYRLSDRLLLRGGYQLMWIDGVALAPSQMPELKFTTQTGLPTTGNEFWAGDLVLSARRVFPFGSGWVRPNSINV